MTLTEDRPALALRGYQREAIDKVLAAEARGVRRQLGVAATGSGKTVCFAALARERGGRTLILAHRDELVAQAVEKLRTWWPGVDVGIVKGAEDHTRSQVVVASVQTLARMSRLDRLCAAWEDDAVLTRPSDPFDLVVVDEAHHAKAESYGRILQRLRTGEEDGPLLLGVTATPDRGDGKGLDDLFDEITFSYDTLWCIRAGYLCDVRGKRITLDGLDMSGVKVRQGDYEAGETGRRLEDAGAPEAIVKAWHEHAIGRRTIVFTPTVETARLTAEAFQRVGVRAEWASGQTSTEDRRALVRRFSTGEVDVVANCALWTEGFDEPRADCIVVARPTRSRALYAQMVGRGLRRHPDKADCLVLDLVGVSDDLSLVTVPSLFGIENPREWEASGEGVVASIDRQEQEMVRAGLLRAEDVDLFKRMREASEIAWVQIHEPGALKRYERSLGKNAEGELLPTVVFRQRRPGDDSWTAYTKAPRGDETLRVLIAEATMELAQGMAEDFVRTHGIAVLTRTDAPWRQRRPTPKQLIAARKWRMPVDPEWNAGQLSENLDAHIARRTGRKA